MRTAVDISDSTAMSSMSGRAINKGLNKCQFVFAINGLQPTNRGNNVGLRCRLSDGMSDRLSNRLSMACRTVSANADDLMRGDNSSEATDASMIWKDTQEVCRRGASEQ